VAGDGTRENFHRSARPRPPPANTPDPPLVPTAPQVTAPPNDLAGSLVPHQRVASSFSLAAVNYFVVFGTEIRCKAKARPLLHEAGGSGYIVIASRLGNRAALSLCGCIGLGPWCNFP
jgi:hypothetical protein